MIEHDRFDADEAAIADGAAVQYDGVPHRYIVAEREGDSVIRVQHRPVLHVRARADDDRVVVASNDDVEPHRRAILKNDAADERRVGSDEVTLTAKLHTTISERKQHSATDRQRAALWN